MDYDVVVIGAGTGGYPCAIRLAQLGKKVAIIEEDKVGGVCLNVGCIPSKAVIQAGHRLRDAQHGERYGINAKSVSFDMAKMRAWKQEVVNKLVSGVKQLLKGNGVETLVGRAEVRSADKNGVVLSLTQEGATKDIRCEQLVVATGSFPIDLPAFKIDGKTVLGSAEVLELEEVPERTVILGGGYIGLELGGALANFGSKVTVVEMMPKLLTGFEPDLVQVVERRMKQMGVTFMLETKAEAIVKDGKQSALKVSTKNGSETLPYDALVVTIGRKPRGKELGLDRFGVVVDDKGFVQVDNQLRTKNPRIFAIGDVCGQPMLAHKATRDGEVAAEVIAGHGQAAIQNKVIPAVVFCDPELASAGLTEAEAKATGRKVETARFPFAALGRALAGGETDGYCKLVFDAESRVVLGVHIAGPHATDLISEGALAIEMGALVDDIGLTVHPHPTLGEIMLETAKVGMGEAVHVLLPKRPSAAAAR